jgi:uncharacterized membrane protein
VVQGEKDDKIIAVCADDPEFRHYTDIKELPPHRLAEIRRFFEDCILLFAFSLWFLVTNVVGAPLNLKKEIFHKKHRIKCIGHFKKLYMLQKIIVFEILTIVVCHEPMKALLVNIWIRT